VYRDLQLVTRGSGWSSGATTIRSKERIYHHRVDNSEQQKSIIITWWTGWLIGGGVFADFGVAEGDKGIAQLEGERLVDQRFWSF